MMPLPWQKSRALIIWNMYDCIKRKEKKIITRGGGGGEGVKFLSVCVELRKADCRCAWENIVSSLIHTPRPTMLLPHVIPRPPSLPHPSSLTTATPCCESTGVIVAGVDVLTWPCTQTLGNLRRNRRHHVDSSTAGPRHALPLPSYRCRPPAFPHLDKHRFQVGLAGVHVPLQILVHPLKDQPQLGVAVDAVLTSADKEDKGT